MNILEAMDDPALFGPWFAHWVKKGTDKPWRVFLAALFGLAVTGADALLLQCTGRSTVPPGGFFEAWCIVGRRGGKSFITALIGTWLAAFVDYRPYLQLGERVLVMVLATDRRQARVIMRYATAFFTNIPMLAALVERMTDEVIDLTNGVSIEITTASMRTVRGYTIAAVLADETAYWRSDESANPDSEILAALRPGMATIPTARMICIGSPYAKRGEMWNAFRRYHGKEDAPVLVWKAPTRVMNPSVRQSIVEEAFAIDAQKAASEYGRETIEFRSDIEAFVLREVIERAMRVAPLELPYDSKLRYFAFTDPSGGGADGFTLAIGHRTAEKNIVIDALRERKGVPGAIVEEYAGLLKAYRVSRVKGDKYAGSWPSDEFKRHGITYEPAGKPKSDLYVDALALLNSGRVELPPDPKLLLQFIGLERRTSSAGKDSIDHAPNCHDDRSNAAAGLIATSGALSTYTLDYILDPAPTPAEVYYRNRPWLTPHPTIPKE